MLKKVFGRKGRLQSSDSLRAAMGRVASVLGPVGTVIDAGAYHGLWTRTCHDFFSGSSWLLVEPQIEQWHLIRKNLRSLPVDYGLVDALLYSEADVEKDFFVVQGTTNLTGSSIYAEKVNALAAKTRKTTTLDAVLEQQGLSGRSAFLKMDIQGAELDCLKGSKRLLENLKGLLLEANLKDYNLGSPGFHDLDNWLAAEGFRLFDIAGLSRLRDGRLNQLDAIYLPASHPAFFI